jgi:hypothetical protein
MAFHNHGGSAHYQAEMLRDQGGRPALLIVGGADMDVTVQARAVFLVTRVAPLHGSFFLAALYAMPSLRPSPAIVQTLRLTAADFPRSA